MNLNEVIQEIPTVIRGRFAGNANASWIMWAGDVITRINAVFPGLGRVRKAPVRLMKSGFIRNPGYLKQVSNIYVDGVEIKFTQQVEGSWLDADDLEANGAVVKCSEYPASTDSSTGEAASLVITVPYPSFAEDITPSVTCTILSMGVNASQNLANITNLVGAAFDDLPGRLLFYMGEEYRITTSGEGFPGEFQLELATEPPNVTEAVPMQQISGMSDDALAGWAFSADADFFEIIASKWVKPISTPGGWTADPRNSVDFKEPARVFAWADGAVFKSNVVAKGYAPIKRPTSMTEELGLPVEYRELLAMGMRLRAELDMAPASADAGAVMALFDRELRRYANDNQNADGKSVKRAFNCSPRLGRHTR